MYGFILNIFVWNLILNKPHIESISAAQERHRLNRKSFFKGKSKAAMEKNEDGYTTTLIAYRWAGS